ncbi:MAG: flagellar assembly protein FliW [Candidatus Omnitrophica bacterium]|nr:flagellar assembly protein FliW [Candidatus Omnitrophota bacterium]
MAVVISTPRFKNVKIYPEKTLSFPQGIIGFENFREWVLIDRGNAFLWLQSLTNPDLCFLSMEPQQVAPAYQPELSAQDKKVLETEDSKGLTFLSLITVDVSHENIFVNLKSPIAINFRKKVGMQVILENGEYSMRYPLETWSRQSILCNQLEKSVVKI